MDGDDYSDTSDEDFVPQGADCDSDDDDAISGDDENSDSEVQNGKSRKRRGVKKKKDKLHELDQSEAKQADKISELDNKQAKEKESNLWSDFLADVEDEPVAKPKQKKNSWASILGTNNKKDTKEKENEKSAETTDVQAEKVKRNTFQNPAKVKVTKIFEYAGEEVRVEQEVSSDSPEARAALIKQSTPDNADVPAESKKRAGLSGVVGFLESKRQKLSTLEKTKYDWVKYKSEEGIEEELETHLKSKEGYLERQDFLERADVRQFELERDMRMKARSKR